MSAPAAHGERAGRGPTWTAVWAAALHGVQERRAGRRVPPWVLPQPLDEATARLVALYEPLVQRPAQAPPYVLAHLGQSLDGFIATRSGDSRFVTGESNLDHMHRLRALCDAVVVGAGTVVADDPRLTTRRVPGPHATRVVLDPMQRVPPTARVLQDGEAQTLWLTDERWHDPARAARVAARTLPLPGLCGGDGRLDAAVALRALVAQGLRVVFVEGGGVTVSRFLEQGLLDRLHLALAPVLIGEGRRGLSLPPGGTMADCPRYSGRVVRLGDDMLWDFDLRAARATTQGDDSPAASPPGEQLDVADAHAGRPGGGAAPRPPR